MKAFFDRHEVDKKGETWDEQGKGWQAWNGWGGDAGYSWAKKVVGQMESRDKNLSEPKDQTEFAEDDATLNPCGMKDDGTFDDENSCSSGYGRPKLVGGYTPKRPGGKIVKKPTIATPPPAPSPAPKPAEAKKGAPPPPLKPGQKLTESQKERLRIQDKMSNNGKVVVNLPGDVDISKKIEGQYDNLISKGYSIPPPGIIGVEPFSGRYKMAYAVATTVRTAKGIESQSIRYNTKYDNNSKDGLLQSVDQNVKDKWFSSSDTFAHEYGHILHHNKLAFGESLQYKRGKFGTGKIKQQRLAIAGQVSEYAKTNPMEFVAEVFSGHVNGKKYTKSVMEMYKFYKGPDLK
jgi:hypothetical protein